MNIDNDLDIESGEETTDDLENDPAFIYTSDNDEEFSESVSEEISEDSVTNKLADIMKEPNVDWEYLYDTNELADLDAKGLINFADNSQQTLDKAAPESDHIEEEDLDDLFFIYGWYYR